MLEIDFVAERGSVMEDENKSDVSLEKLIEYLSGKCGPEESERWRRRLQDPDSPETRLLKEVGKLPDIAFRREAPDATALPLEEVFGEERESEGTTPQETAPSGGKRRPTDKPDWQARIKDTPQDKPRTQ